MTTACAGATNEGDPSSTSLYALVQGIDGVYFYPPLGPDPSFSGTFEADLLDGISVSIEAESADGQLTQLALFDQTTQPAVALLAERERYFVNIPAATYVTDPSKTYRIRMLLDGAELGSSVLSPHVFDVLAWNPALPIGVMVRVEGSGAVRALPRVRQHATGTPAHCTDGRRNKDETGVDCGGSCRPCCIPSAEVCDGLDNDCDGAIDEGNPGGGGACSTGLAAACATGTLTCTGGALVCVPNVLPQAETCDRVDNDCDGVVDNGTCTPNPPCAGAYSATIDGYQGCLQITSFNQVMHSSNVMFTVIDGGNRYGPTIPAGWRFYNNCATPWVPGFPWRPNALGYWPVLIGMACH